MISHFQQPIVTGVFACSTRQANLLCRLPGKY